VYTPCCAFFCVGGGLLRCPGKVRSNDFWEWKRKGGAKNGARTNCVDAWEAGDL